MLLWYWKIDLKPNCVLSPIWLCRHSWVVLCISHFSWYVCHCPTCVCVHLFLGVCVHANLCLFVGFPCHTQQFLFIPYVCISNLLLCFACFLLLRPPVRLLLLLEWLTVYVGVPQKLVRASRRQGGQWELEQQQEHQTESIRRCGFSVSRVFKCEY